MSARSSTSVLVRGTRRDLIESAIARKQSIELENRKHWDEVSGYYKLWNVQSAKRQSWESESSREASMAAYSKMTVTEISTERLKERKAKLKILLSDEQRQHETDLRKINRQPFRNDVEESSDTLDENHSISATKVTDGNCSSEIESDSIEENDIQIDKKIRIRYSDLKRMEKSKKFLQIERRRLNELENLRMESSRLRERVGNENARIHLFQRKDYKAYLRLRIEENLHEVKQDLELLRKIKVSFGESLMYEDVGALIKRYEMLCCKQLDRLKLMKMDFDLSFQEEIRSMIPKEENEWKDGKSLRDDQMNQLTERLNDILKLEMKKNFEKQNILAQEWQELTKYVF